MQISVFYLSIYNIHINTRETITRYFLRNNEQQQTTGTIYNQPIQYLAYADDISLLGKSKKDITQSFIELEDASQKAGLEINSQKTKYMFTGTSKEETQMENVIKVRNHNFEKVNNFKYLGATITANNDILEEVKQRITAGNKAYYSSYNMLKNKNISRKTKTKIYKTIIRPVVTYGSETWTLTKKTETIINT